MRPSPALALAAGLAACAPELPNRSPKGSAAGVAPHLEAVPTLASDGTVAPITQLVLTGDGAVDPRAFVLVEGDVSDVALRGFRDGAPPASTAARVVPTHAFVDDSGAVVVVPERALSPTPHTLVLTAPPQRIAVSVRDRGTLRLARAFPPLGAPFATPLALFCGDTPLPASARALGRVAEGRGAQVSAGAFGDDAFDHCVTIATDYGALPVGLYADGAVIAALDPTPIGTEPPPAPLGDASCRDGVSLGPACASVDDDRLVVAAADTPLFALVHVGGASAIGMLTSPLVLRGLTPSSTITLTTRLVDLGGRTYDTSTSILTRDAHAHLVLNEVLAHPFGDEPASEWVELLNDGTIDIDLGDWGIQDAHGTYAIPSTILAPGAFALLVNQKYSPDDLDVPPAPDTTIVRLEHLGKYGLSNEGAALTILAPDGTTSSSPSRKSTQGRSLARVRPEALDGDTAWVDAAPTPGATN